LVNSLAFDVPLEATEVDGVQAQGALGQLSWRQDFAFVGVEEAFE
jgi:hypothetical protein